MRAQQYNYAEIAQYLKLGDCPYAMQKGSNACSIYSLLFDADDVRL